MNFRETMSINDLILLSILSSKKEMTLSKIVEKFRKLELEKLPTRTGIYRRLNILSTKRLVEISWERGQKLYKSSLTGIKIVEKFRENLNQFKQNESKSN